MSTSTYSHEVDVLSLVFPLDGFDDVIAACVFDALVDRCLFLFWFTLLAFETLMLGASLLAETVTSTRINRTTAVTYANLRDDHGLIRTDVANMIVIVFTCAEKS